MCTEAGAADGVGEADQFAYLAAGRGRARCTGRRARRGRPVIDVHPAPLATRRARRCAVARGGGSPSTPSTRPPRRDRRCFSSPRWTEQQRHHLDPRRIGQRLQPQRDLQRGVVVDRPAATGAQQTGADISTWATSSAYSDPARDIDIYQKGGIIERSVSSIYVSQVRRSLMSRVQLALNVDDLDEAITFYSKLFNTEPAKLKEGYANFAIAEPPLKLVLLREPRPGRHHQPPRRRGRVQRAGARRDRPTHRRGPVHRRGDRHHLLLRHPGQGVGDRARRGAVGGLHRARRLRDVRPAPTTSCC